MLNTESEGAPNASCSPWSPTVARWAPEQEEAWCYTRGLAALEMGEPRPAPEGDLAVLAPRS